VATYDIEGAVDYVAKTKPETKVTEEPKYDIDGAVNSVLSLKETQKKRAATITSIASSFNPDEIAQLRYLGKQAGIPDAIAERNPAEVKRKALSLKVEQLYDNSPVTGRKLADPAFSKITHDITDELVNTESSMRNLSLSAKGNALGSQTADTNINKGLRGNFTKDRDILGNIGLAAKGGLIGTKTGALGSLESAANTVEDLPDVVRAALTQVPGGSVLGLMPNKMLQGIAEQVSAYFGDAALQSYKDQQANFAQIDSGSETETAAYQGIQSAVQTISTLPLAALTRNPYLLTVPMAGLTYGQSYTKGGAEGLDDPARAVYAGIDSVIEYGTEVFSISPLMKILKGQTGFVKDAGEFFVKDVIGEQVATFFQDMNEWGTLRPDATFGDFLNERGSAAYQTLIATLVGGSVQTGAAKGLSYIVSKGADIEQNNAKAESTLQAFAEIQKLSEQSTLKQRSAQDFATFLQEAGGENGIEEVYIDARTFMQEAQNLGVDVNTLMQSSPVIQKQLEEAIAQGIDLVIPVGEFGATIAGTDLGGAVLQHLRADENGISAFEAKTQLDTAVEELQKQAENVAQQYQDNEAWTQSLTEVSDNLLGQLNTLGRFTPENNQAYVSGLVAPWYSTLASNLGITPSEAYARYPLQVSGQVTAEGFEQGGAVLSNVIKSWDNAGIKSFVSENNGIINVSQIVVPENNRGNGVGSKAIQELIDYADLTNQRITLTPSTDYGATSKKRLTGFYKRFGFVENKGKNRDFSTMEGMYRDPNDANILNQKVEQKARGQISFSNDITQGANITLLKNADASTFIHELGHFFLEVYADVASKPDAPQSIVDDMNQLFNWFGIESTEQPALDVWRNMTIDQKRFYHEKLARGFEQYAMEGTAPTLELSRVFAKLRSFMLSAYKSLKQFFERSGEPGLTNEVRQVFDRMLASDEAINKAEAVRGMMPMFASMEEAGMSIDEYAEYLQNQQDATDEAKTALTARSLRDMKWLQGARSRVLKDLQRQADTERRMVRMAVRREVMTQPVYQAYSWLKQIPDETKAQQAEKVKATKGVDVEKDSLYTAIAKLGGLNRQLAASEWGLDPKDRFDSGVFGKPVLRKDGGLSVDEMAEALSQYEYLTKDENGKWDLREFEDKFFEEARGEKQYSLFAEGEQYRKWQESIYDEQERVRLDAFGKGKLDLNMMRGMYGEEGEWRNLGVGRSGMVMELGNPPDAVAELFGFNSGDQLVKSLLAAENPKSLIDRLTDERMLAEFGDLVDAKKMNEAADKAVHNEVRARVLATELSAQNKALGNRRILEAAAKEYAQQKIAQKTVKDIKPYIYTRAEEKSAKLAEKSMRQGDTNTVVQAKRDQLLNNRIAKEAFAALDEIEKYIDKVRKLNKSSVQGNMRGEPLVQMLAVLERFDFRTGVSNAQLAEIRGKEPLAQWVEKEAERLVAVIPNLPDFVLDETYRKSYKDMTLAELRDLMGAVTQLEQLARRENKQYKEIRNQTFQEEKATILEQIKKTYPQLFDAEGKVKADIPSLVVKLEDKIADSKDGMLSGYLNITAMAEILDGGQTNGTVFESLFGRYSEASNYKSNRLSEIYAELKPYLKDQYSLAERRAFSRRDIGTNTVGISLTRENAVVAVALYGSEEGRQRLSNWFDAGQMQQIIDLLDQRDIELVKTLWRVSDEMIWPELESVNNRTKGISPPKVKGVAFDTKFGTLEGGYFHLDYRSADNPEKGVQVQTFDASKSLDELRAGIGMSRATRQGTSKERVTQSNLRPNLHLDVFSSAVNETLHDIAFREALADTMRLLNDNQVALALKKSLGEKHYKAITQRISEIAIPQYNPTGMMEKAFSIARKNTVAVLLSGMTTALQNFTGLSPALTKVKPALVLKNLAKFYSPSMSKNINFAIENSPYMKSRLMNGYDRDVQGMIKEFTVNSNITPDTKYALFLMGLVDVGVSFPVWNAAFEQNMTETKNDVEASVKFADAVIQTTMGSGRDVDQSTMVSGKGAMNAFKQMFLMFFNYFQAQGQRLVVAGAISKQQWNSGNRANAVANFTVKYIFIVALPAIITEFLFGWGDDDDEEYMKRSIESVVFFQTAMIPLVRDVARPVWNQFDEDVRSFGYKMSPVESAIQMAIQTPGSIQDLWEGSGDDRDIKRVIMGAGFLTGMPGKLISDVTLGTKAYMEGEAGPQAIIVGPPRD
jgi:GNAT superfamily N-acetyltransferase